MRGKLSILLGIFILGLLSISFISSSKSQITGYNNAEFKTYTKAICNANSGLNYCVDELFVQCNGKLYSASQINECNGFEVKNKVITKPEFYRQSIMFMLTSGQTYFYDDKNVTENPLRKDFSGSRIYRLVKNEDVI